MISTRSWGFPPTTRALIGSLLLGILVVPLWAFAPTVTLLLTGAFLIQFLVQGAWGVIPAHLTELSPDDIRGSLPGFAHQCGVLLAGSVAYFEAVLAGRFSYSRAMAAACGRENNGIEFGGDA